MKLLTANWDEGDCFELFDTVEHITKPEQITGDNEVLILWGGEDIATEIYGQKPNKYVYQQYKSERDRREIALIEQAIAKDVPIIGICRGAQLLCAVAGGTLAQHIEGHGGSHPVTLEDEGGSVIRCNSSHHQMMVVTSSAKILATSEGTWGNDEYNKPIKYNKVNEVVWFPTISALGIQPHPEWSNCPKEFLDYCIRKIREYIL
jgi:gamma-glutamyl-gamma-aminobutyrate hydrolase PuuD